MRSGSSSAGRRRWTERLGESARLALDALRVHPGRSLLAIAGIVIGIVTVVLVASVLVNVRNQIALLFRDLGTDNVFAFHLTGDPYATASEKEARRKPLEPGFAREIARLGQAVRAVGVQLIVPTVVGGRAVIARAAGNESDTLLLEGVSANFFDIVGADFAAGRPFTDLEDRVGARVAVIGSSLSRALFAGRPAVGRTVTLLGESYTVVGELAPRRGGFFGENRQNTILSIPFGTARRRFPEADRTVLYVQALPGQRDLARRDTETTLRALRKLAPGEANDFHLSTADQIIRSFDDVGGRINLVTFGLALVSLVIGAIGIANVMVISVTERTREIGLRLALGARRQEVQQQFLLESVLLSGLGGVAGVALAFALGLLLTLVVRGFSARAPLWAIGAGLVASLLVGVVAGYLPARRAALLDPVEALRHE